MTKTPIYLAPALTLRRSSFIFSLLLLLLACTACASAGTAAVVVDSPKQATAGDTQTDTLLPPQAPAAPVAPVPVLPLPLAWAASPHPRSGLMPAAPETGALAAVVVDEASGEVLYDKNAHESLPPASLTKIATLILALESNRLDEWVDVDVDSRLMPGSSIMGLLPGDRFTLRDLLYGLMLPSGNDAALSIGRHIAGSDAAFVALMNGLLVRLGLHESHFLNPHGLSGNDHYTSAYDLAILARYGMSLPGFEDIVTARYYVAAGENRAIELSNVNTFLNSYPGADGVKTGYTRRAGQTLAASATRNGHRLYAIVLNSTTRDDDARRLLNWAFTNLAWD